MKSRKIKWAGLAARMVLVWKREGKRPFGRPRYR
jgi:hypothetical protein